jgi:hypothetical protein
MREIMWFKIFKLLAVLLFGLFSIICLGQSQNKESRSPLDEPPPYIADNTLRRKSCKKCLTYEKAETAEEMKISRFPHTREAHKESRAIIRK